MVRRQWFGKTGLRGGYTVAVGTTDITPPRPIALAGYATLRKATFDRISDPLEANIVVLRDGNATIAFVAFDLMYVGPELRRRIADAVAGRIEPDAIFMSASHTHHGPPTDVSIPVLGAVDRDYVTFAAERVSALLASLLDRTSEPVVMTYAEGEAFHSINRRLPVFGFGRDFPFLKRRYQNRPNQFGARDDVIRVVRLRAETGKDVAIGWSYACHPVAFPILDNVSADFPGVVRRMLRETFGEIPVVYWQGFSGDIRPCAPSDILETTTSGQAPRFRALTQSEWSAWSRSLATSAIEIVQTDGHQVGGAISHHARSIPISEFGPASPKSFGMQEIRFGDDLSICGVSAEVAVGYVGLLATLRAPVPVIPVGCVDGVSGYLPTSAMVREGGYEAEGFLPRFGLKGGYRADVSDIVERRLFKAFK